jgi:hypothetical protein
MILVQSLRQLSSGSSILAVFLLLSLFSCRSRYEIEQEKLEQQYEKQVQQEKQEAEEEKVKLKSREKDSLDKIFPVTIKQTYTIDYLFPFSFDRIYDEEFKLDHSQKATLEFYMGSKLALKFLPDSNMKIKANYINTNTWDFSDSADLDISEVKDADILIGPFVENEVLKVSEKTMQKKINMVSPFAHCSECLETNPYFFSLKPSQSAYIEYVYNFLQNNFKEYNIHLVVEKKKVADMYLSEFISIADTSVFNSVETHVINNVNWNSVSLSKNISKEKNIILILMENDFVINSITTNLVRSEKEKLLIVPMQWLEKNTINIDYLHRLNTYYLTDFYLNFQDSMIIQFAQIYREEFKTEPTKYSYLGFKSTQFALKNMNNGGVYFQRNRNELKCENTDDSFVRDKGKLGFECCGIEMWGFKEYEFVKIPMILPPENEEGEEGSEN